MGSLFAAKATVLDPPTFEILRTSPELIEPMSVDLIFVPDISKALRIKKVPS